MINRILAVAVASALMGSGASYAAVSDAEFAELRAQMLAMSERLSRLEAENNQLREQSSNTITQLEGTREELDFTREEVAVVKKQAGGASWADTVKWSGDFRYRYEEIKQGAGDKRDRNRIRARAHLGAKTSKTTEVGLGLATGGDDPVSTNQTLGGGGSTKDIRLDLAYFTWTGLENTAFTAGKFKNPFYRVDKSQLIFDGDFRPEGAALQWAGDLFFANATYSFIESDSNSVNGDEGFWIAQVGASFPLFTDMKLTASASYLDFPTAGFQAVVNDNFFGNSSIVEDGVDVYRYDYRLYEGSLGLSFNLFETPMSVYGNYVQNDDADEFDTGYLVGLALGDAKGRGSWQLRYQYENLEADATLGVLTDSNFMGGGTDGEGSRYSARYMIDNDWYISTTYFHGDTDGNLAEKESYRRWQVDTGFKY